MLLLVKVKVTLGPFTLAHDTLAKFATSNDAPEHVTLCVVVPVELGCCYRCIRRCRNKFACGGLCFVYKAFPMTHIYIYRGGLGCGRSVGGLTREMLWVGYKRRAL